MENNFIDPETKEEFFIPNYRIFGNSVFKDKKGNLIKNPKNGNNLVLIEKGGKIEAPYFLKSNSKEERVKMLKDRSSKHFKKEIEEIKLQKNKDLIKKFES